MAYIGRQLVRGQNRVLDDISSSFNGSTTAFNLTVSSSSSPPASVNQLWIILGGVLQKPGTDFTVADAVITFTTAPASTLNFWGMIQGDTSDINSPADASVTPSKIANSGDFAFPADVRFNDADGSHYVGLQAPSTVSSNLVWTLPAADGSANQLLKTDGSGALGWASDANAPEGTSVLSTGETGTTKYLRVDGDNTCSWQLAVDATKATLTGSTNNTVCTVTGANAIAGEANLTFDGSVLHVVSSGNNTTLLVESTDADANVGPIIELFRNSSSPADNDVLGRIDFKGDDDAGNASSFARIAVTALDVSNGSEDARIDFIAATNDTFTSTMSIAGGKVGIGLDTGIQSKLHVQDVEGTTLTLGNTDAAASDGDYLSGIDFWIKDNNDSTGAATASIRTFADQNHTASAKGTALSFHTTDDDTTTLDERMRITHDGKCGIGCIPTEQFHVLKSHNGHTRAVIQNNYGANATAQLKLIAPTDEFQLIKYASGDAALNLSNSANVYFSIGGSEELRIQSGGGISFNGDTAAANALDDYEEGTWTGGLITGTATHDKTTYRKIGSVVHIWGRLYGPSDTTSSNNVVVTGLPFSVADGTAVGSCFGKDIDNKETLTVFVNTNEYLYFYGIQDSNAWNILKHSNFNSGNVELYYHATYWTTD